VIKPVIPKFLSDTTRISLKNKNEKWEEKAKARDSPKKPRMTLSAKGEELFNEMGGLSQKTGFATYYQKPGQSGKRNSANSFNSFQKMYLKIFLKTTSMNIMALKKKSRSN